jgi:signal transduction histidine kinase
MDRFRTDKIDNGDYAAGYYAGLNDVNSRIDSLQMRHKEDIRTTVIVVVIAIIVAFVGGFVVRDLL